MATVASREVERSSFVKGGCCCGAAASPSLAVPAAAAASSWASRNGCVREGGKLEELECDTQVCETQT